MPAGRLAAFLLLGPALAAGSLAAPVDPLAASLPEPVLDRPVIRVSPFTYHFAHYSDHKPVVAVGLEVPMKEPGDFMGMSFFSNSFGQPSVYVYLGSKYARPFGWERTYWHLTAGIMYGYVEPYAHKVPFNSHGFAPGIVPSFGYQLTRQSSVELSMLGFAGAMISYVKHLD